VLIILGGLLGLALLAGSFGALSGLGGGVFIVPGLVILAHMPMRVAIGAGLILVVAISAGASVAFVRDGWTNLGVAMILECATVSGVLLGAYLAGVVPPVVLELLFALMMLQSAYFSLSKQSDESVPSGDRWSSWLKLDGEFTNEDGTTSHYGVVNSPGGQA
jgi:uncharacterized membrane protein YfcA